MGFLFIKSCNKDIFILPILLVALRTWYFIYLKRWPEDVVSVQRNMLSFSFKNVVFYIQVLGNLICVENFGKVIFAISKHHNWEAGADPGSGPGGLAPRPLKILHIKFWLQPSFYYYFAFVIINLYSLFLFPFLIII